MPLIGLHIPTARVRLSIEFDMRCHYHGNLNLIIYQMSDVDEQNQSRSAGPEFGRGTGPRALII
jgi:hypothetical protein